MEEDAEDPKEPAHLDYKYLKSFEGPLDRSGPQVVMEFRNTEAEREELVKQRARAKIIQAYERKKFGGIRIC